MKIYDLIAIGSGSALNIVQAVLQDAPHMKIAVIDKDPPGGICLTKGCIPTKLLVYPAELVRTLDAYASQGIDVSLGKVHFKKIMGRMRSVVMPEIKRIRRALSQTPNVDYYASAAEFVRPYQLRVDQQLITANLILLGLGSRPCIPPIKNLDGVDYHTSDTILNIKRLPDRLAIIGGGYIAAEFGHFFSAMGSRVTVIGRNPQWLPREEPEISDLARRKMSRHLKIFTGWAVDAVARTPKGTKRIIAKDVRSGKSKTVESDEILIAAGRCSNADILKPERSEIETDANGWITVSPYLETSKSNIWAFGDATGKHPFKHVANYESRVVFYNAVLKENVKADYRAIPHAVFSVPEIAAVGLTESQASRKYGADRLRIGFNRFQDTARGEAMNLKDYFVKVIIDGRDEMILGAHIIGPHASMLIQEIITLMHTRNQGIAPITAGMHIHPSLSEVVERAFLNLMPVDAYHDAVD